MAVNWNWKNKMGSITTHNTRGEKIKINLYQANCLGALIYEFKDDDGKAMYEFVDWWQDLAHLKRCLGLAKGYDSLYTDFVKIRLNIAYKDCIKIAELFAKANIKTILYYEEVK